MLKRPFFANADYGLVCCALFSSFLPEAQFFTSKCKIHLRAEGGSQFFYSALLV